MARRRPCKICGRWFKPDPRAGNRQQTCSNKACQKERHRRNCEVINQANRDNERAHRVRQKLQKVPPAKSSLSNCRGPTPDKQICWPLARKAVGVEVAVLVEMSLKSLQAWVQDSVHTQPQGP